MNPLRELSYAECRDLLATGTPGRLAVVTDEGPVVVPLNHAVVGESVVVATAAHTVVARHAPGRRVAFQVDLLDHDRHRGWSVLATGPAELLDDAEERALVRRTWEPRPWADGDRDVWLRVRWDRLTGRILGSGWTRQELTEVRRFLHG